MHAGQPHWFDFLGLGVNGLLAGLLVWLTAIQLRRRRPLVVASDLMPQPPHPWSVVMENRGDAGVTIRGVIVEVSPIRGKAATRIPWRWVWLSRGWDRWRRYKPVPGVAFIAADGSARFMPGHTMSEYAVLIPERELPRHCWIRLKPIVSHGGVRSTSTRHQTNPGVSISVGGSPARR